MTPKEAGRYMKLEREILELAPDGWIARERNRIDGLRDLTKDFREHVGKHHEIGPYVICELPNSDFGRFHVFAHGKDTHHRYGSLEAAIFGALFHGVDDQGRAAECAFAMWRGLAPPRPSGPV